LIKRTILPPQTLFHPVLPLKHDGKLLFVLCGSCGETMSAECQRDDVGRQLTGTWVSEEVYKALELAYQVRKLF